jgi:deoxyribonuclease V
VRTRAGVKPVYVSVGSGLTLPEAVALTLVLTTRYKLPEPTRLAHHLSRDVAAAPWIGDEADPEA